MSELPRSLKIATVWLLAGVLLFLGVQAWQARQQAALFSTPQSGRIEIRRAADGHYHWPATVNGRAVDFLIDTGATTSALPEALAAELNLPTLGSVRSQTAGGTAQGRVVAADLALRGGVQLQRARLVALPRLQSPLLGMDVLGKLQWRQGEGVLSIELGAAPPP